MTGWGGLIIYIVAYDVWQWQHGKPTMSAIWWDWIGRNPSRILCILVWAFLTVHLFGKVGKF